jgi:tRNA threonylcarbamoyladenosine biosynthesis protein TsaB
MITLVIDASTPTLFLGLMQNKQVLGYHVETLARQQSEWMMPRLIDLLTTHHLTLQDVTDVIVGDGPGSFTGVRLALTLVKTFGLIHAVKVYAISSLHLMAIAPLSLVTMDARGDRDYVAVFEGPHEHLAPCVVPHADVQRLQTQYPKAQRLTPEVAFAAPDQILTHLITLKPNLSPIEDIHRLNPRYLKELL